MPVTKPPHGDAVEKTVRRLSDEDRGETAEIAIIGARQAGYIGFRLGIALAEMSPSIAYRLSMTTFYSAPMIDHSSEIEGAIDAATTNYRDAFSGATPNLLSYRLGEYVTMIILAPGHKKPVLVSKGS